MSVAADTFAAFVGVLADALDDHDATGDVLAARLHRRELYPVHAPATRRSPARRWVGRQMMRIGLRLAAEPSPEPAGSFSEMRAFRLLAR